MSDELLPAEKPAGVRGLEGAEAEVRRFPPGIGRFRVVRDLVPSSLPLFDVTAARVHVRGPEQLVIVGIQRALGSRHSPDCSVVVCPASSRRNRTTRSPYEGHMNGDIRDLLVEIRKPDNPPPEPKT
nr:hypothetical protein [Lentzea flava]